MQLSCGRKGRTKHLISPALRGKEKKTKKIQQLLDFETEELFTLNALQGFLLFSPSPGHTLFVSSFVAVDITGALNGDSFSAS